MKFFQSFSQNQISALLRKDILVRIRKPWMTIIQFLWPILIFLSLYTLRNKFQAKNIPNCQFPTRQLPTKNNVIPFFHSYICTIENKCENVDEFNEYSKFDNAPLKPILNIVQILLNEKVIYNSIIDLPNNANWISTITTIATHPKFNEIQKNVEKVVASLPVVEKQLNGSFDIKKMFSDDENFSKSGQIICGIPFPRSNDIRLVNDILYSEDLSKANEDELNAMPTKYCKQLYLDVTSTNRGKITWTEIKPIVQGKLIYGPDNNDTLSIIKFANNTFEEMNNLKMLAAAFDTTINKLHTNKTFVQSFKQLLDLVKSPLVKAIIGNSVDVNQIESFMNHLSTDQIYADIFQTVNNIFQCFSVDRFILVNNENELNQKAFELNKKRLFYAGIYFNNTNTTEINYKIRVDADNTPITIETKNRFWFPGPQGSMAEDLRYHRGFVQIKHAIDIGIIKHKKSIKLKNEQHNQTIDEHDEADHEFLKRFRDEHEQTKDNDHDEIDFDNDDDDFFDESSDFIAPNETEIKNPPNQSPEITDQNSTETQTTESTNPSLSSKPNVSENFELDPEHDGSKDKQVRKKRQFSLFSLFGGTSAPKPEKTQKFLVDDIKMFTKQFPYPEYIEDDFKKGIYLAQSVQMAFFLGLLIQIASCVRYRIWMKESKNTMLMRAMGLKSSSEIISWLTITFIELILIFLIACIILYVGEILLFTKFLFIFIFLIVFGLCIISFCYMCSTIFSSASIGSVSSSILFLISFLPYIVIICLDINLTTFLRFITNLSFSTAFCYAFEHIMRKELQGLGMTFSDAFNDGLNGEFSYGICMIILDTIIYIIIGYFVERIKDDEYKFQRVDRDDLDPQIGATFENVSKIYDNNKVVVTNITLEFPKDKITCLLGRNGAGKSTILKMLTGQINPTNGKIFLSQALTSRNEQDKIGLCCQDNILIPHLTAKEHLEMYAKIKIKKNFKLEIDKTMKSLNLGEYENYQAYKLSGGYQRRLCVAIAFIGSPSIVILDEPCSSIDTKMRSQVWSLVEKLKTGRAVILATHFLDEAEYFSDAVVILNNGEIIAKHNPKSLESQLTKSFQLNIQINDKIPNSIIEIRNILEKFLKNFEELFCSENEIKISISYDTTINNCPGLFKELELLQVENKIKTMNITSKSLETIFNNISEPDDKEILSNGQTKIDEPFHNRNTEKHLTQFDIIRILFWKRCHHFKRNYRLILCILVLPFLFELIAMSFMQLRPGNEYDTQLNLTRNLYPNTVEFFGLENENHLNHEIISNLKDYCNIDKECFNFANSEKAFYWLLGTGNAYLMERYGGVTINDTIANIWYNNKGYHSMISWLNDFNSNMFKVEMNDSDYKITTINHPIQLGVSQLSTSSILQQVSDAGISLILLIAFSLVVAGASVFLVNERVNGEKLQQKLCGVKLKTYWTAAFLWDFIVYLCSLIICICLLKIFNIPIFNAKSNLNGICLIIVLYGFAAIPSVHVFEKLFSEASFANMSIFCMNVIIALTTLTIIILFDVLGESDETAKIRNILNRLFLIFPQHAFADGLIEICKNYITAEAFLRFDINSYKSPVNSNLLLPNYIALIVMGIIFLIINIIIENDYDFGVIKNRIRNYFNRNSSDPVELKIISIQNLSNKNSSFQTYALHVNGLKKSYNKNEHVAIQDVSFNVKSGECYGLLGKNGAGKSTIFKILTGQLRQDLGNFQFLNKEISYCPQTIALDPLLTVREIIEFYGSLRKIPNIKNLIKKVSKSFNLENYQNVLVMNLSGGNRRKLNVAVSCLGDSKIILMDEPTSDMDPITRIFIYKAISKLLEDDKSVLLTSHAISEIDKVCQRIGILNNGKLIDCGSPDELKDKFNGFYNITLFFDQTDSASIERDIQVNFPHYQNIQIHPNSIKFNVRIKGNSSVENVSEKNDITFSQLFSNLKQFISVHKIKFSINRCGLELIIDKILHTNIDEQNSIANNFESDGGGYYHQGFVP